MKQLYALSSLGIAALITTACSGANSGSQFLTSTSVSVSQVGTDSYINLSSVVNLGNAQFSNITIGVSNPKTGENIGDLTFSDVAGTAAGANEGKITLQVNTAVLGVADATLGSALPNGAPLPATLTLNTGTSLGIKLLNDSRIYVGGDLKTEIFAGVALAISGLSSATSGISFGTNIFFTVPFSSTVTGVAGIYTSPTVPNDNGIVVFGKYKSATGPALLSAAAIDHAKAQDFSPYQNLSNHSRNKLLKFFYGKKRTLQIH